MSISNKLTMEAPDANTRESEPSDFLEKLRQQIRKNHRLRWEFARAKGKIDPRSCYVDITHAEVERVVDASTDAMEERYVRSYYDFIEEQDYLNSLDSGERSSDEGFSL